jgi:ATP-binding protein involved in chromosome partitioning
MITNKKILGLIENMSYHVCNKCGETSHIFGHGGVKETGSTCNLLTISAKKMEIPFIGAIPLDTVIRESSDSGKPITVSQPRSTHAKIYQDIATNILEKLNSEQFQKEQSGPKISIE